MVGIFIDSEVYVLVWVYISISILKIIIMDKILGLDLYNIIVVDVM